MKVKDWLVSQGHLTESTRGRLSKDLEAIARKAMADGVVFDNWPMSDAQKAKLPAYKAKAIRDGVAGRDKGKPTPTTSKPVERHSSPYTARKAEVAKGGEDPDIQEIAPYVYPETEFAVYEVELSDKGRRVKRSLREVCEHCRVSLVQCECGRPSIVATNGIGHIRVTIVPETSKLPTKSIWEK